ncbi:transporter, major facilitator family protein [Anopheles sinensis]|uniref:Transporter, major facilitator family protein n=1 Tax=Anopheles sinensis TaxID=74873 RepID=A0A084VGV8_ANOSI|nr:transporter, major facilitator family protein [Anopheles sinensis]
MGSLRAHQALARKLSVKRKIRMLLAVRDFYQDSGVCPRVDPKPDPDSDTLEVISDRILSLLGGVEGMGGGGGMLRAFRTLGRGPAATEICFVQTIKGGAEGEATPTLRSGRE